MPNRFALIGAICLAITAASIAFLAGGATRSTSVVLDTANDAPAPRAGQPAAAEASWISRPATVREQVESADAVVIATVVAVTPGPPIIAAADEVNPTELVRMRVRERWRGTVEDSFTIKWLGTPNHGWIEGDPPYVEGQDYVLFLVARPDGPWYRPESPDGRLQILSGRLRSLIEGPFGDKANGKAPAELRGEVEEAS